MHKKILWKRFESFGSQKVGKLLWKKIRISYARFSVIVFCRRDSRTLSKRENSWMVCLLLKLPNTTLPKSLIKRSPGPLELVRIKFDSSSPSSGLYLVCVFTEFWPFNRNPPKMYHLRNQLLQIRNVRKLQLATRLQQERAKSSLPMNTVICFVRQQVRLVF